MVISVTMLWKWRTIVEDPDALARRQGKVDPNQAADTAATAVDAPPHGISDQEEGGHAAHARAKNALMDAVPDWKRDVTS